MCAARMSSGGEDSKRRDRKEKDTKDDKKKEEKKRKDESPQSKPTLSPGRSDLEKRTPPRSSSSSRSSGAGEKGTNGGSSDSLHKDAARKPLNPDRSSKSGGDKLRERRVIRVQALVRKHQAIKVAAEMVKDHKARTSIVTEILTTERTYVDILRQIVDLFITPLREAPTPLISSKDIRAIFLTNENLYACHATLLSQLESRWALWSPSQVVGDVFLQLIQFLGVYTSYAVFYSEAIQHLNESRKNHKGFSEFVDEALKKVVLPKGKVVDLASLLITPVQRITRYSLLFMDLLKHTAIDHRDYNNLSESFSQVKQAVATIESSTEEVQAMEQTKYIMDNLVLKKLVVHPNPVRRWLRDGGVRVLSSKKLSKEKKRWLILFNDILLFTEREERKKDAHSPRKGGTRSESPEVASPTHSQGIRGSQFRVRKIVPIYQMLLRDGRLRESTEEKHVIEILQLEPNRKLSVVLDSAEARRSWYDDLATALELFQNKSSEEEIENIRQSEARAKALRAAVFSSPTVQLHTDLLASSTRASKSPITGSVTYTSPKPAYSMSPELSDSFVEKPSIYTPVRRAGRNSGYDDKRTSISALTLATLSPLDESRHSIVSARTSSDGTPSSKGSTPALHGSASGSPAASNQKTKRLSLDRKQLQKLNPDAKP